jgi:hypothetical protein
METCINNFEREKCQSIKLLNKYQNLITTRISDNISDMEIKLQFCNKIISLLREILA